MSTLNPERWRTISPYLDEVLSLPEHERTAWVKSFRAKNPDLADLLEELLQEQRVVLREEFLERGPLQDANESSLSGQVIGAYRLISPIGQGGMGSVWLAERSDGRFERCVALKFLHVSLAGTGGVLRFKREGRVLGQLAHPHIAELIDAGVTPNGEPYLILEYVEGKQIDEYCDEHSLGVDARIALFLDVLGAVAHAHANLTVHRDLKPSNVLVSSNGDVKLLDFGIAKLLADGTSSAPATMLTLEGGGAMTPLFAAPEQVNGGTITTATDVYALGALLFLLLTGRHPAGSEPHSPADLIKAIIETEPPRLSDVVDLQEEASAKKRGASPEKLRRTLQGDLDLIVGKALKKNPPERYTSVTAFADDLRRYLRNEPISARRDAVSYRLRKYVRRHRVGVTVAIGLMLWLAAFAVVQAIELRRITRERDRADHIAGFLSDMFSAADPSGSRGNTITAREVLDQATKQIDVSLGKDPQLQAEMMAVVGGTYNQLGIYSAAQPLLEKAIEVGKRANGAGDRDVLTSEDQLGRLLVQQGEFDEADKLLRQALASGRHNLGEKDPVTLNAMSDLAYASLLEGRKIEAFDLARRAFEIRRRSEGEGSNGTLWSMNNLALILGQTGHLPESEAMYRAELEIELRVHGPDTEGALNAMSNLATTLALMGQLSDAEALFKRALPIQQHLFGANHPETGRTLYNLACVAAHQGRSDEAFSLLGQAIPIVYVRTLQGMDRDPDLVSLRGDSRWSAIVTTVKGRISEAQKPSETVRPSLPGRPPRSP